MGVRSAILPIACMLAVSFSMSGKPRGAAASHALGAHARCTMVTKNVHGHKKKVKLCARSQATPTPTLIPHLFDGPSDVVVNAQGNVMIADQHHRRIVTLSPAGTILSSWTIAGNNPGIFDTLYGIALDRAGNVYVTDAANHLIDKLDNTGKPLAQWSTESAEAGSFSTLLAVADNGDVFVSDGMSRSVLHLSSTGTLLGYIGKNQLINPYGITIGPDGNLYIADFGGNRVRAYTPAGAEVASWGDGATGTVRLAAPEAIALDPRGNILVTEQGGDIVQFDQSGTLLTDFGMRGTIHFDDPSGIALDGQGNVYVTDFIANRVVKQPPTGSVLAILR